MPDYEVTIEEFEPVEYADDPEYAAILDGAYAHMCSMTSEPVAVPAETAAA